jgi:hypothetical protein
MTNRPRPRHGYAMVLVVLFLVIFLGLWGQAARQIGTMVRIEEARARRVRRDADRLPAVTALAQALADLELGFPPSSPYTCAVATPDGSAFAATFERDPEHPDEWIVSVVPASDSSLPPLDPAQFAAAPPVLPP